MEWIDLSFNELQKISEVVVRGIKRTWRQGINHLTLGAPGIQKLKSSLSSCQLC